MLAGTFYGTGRAQVHHSPGTAGRHPQRGTPESALPKRLRDESNSSLAQVVGFAEH